MVNATGHRHGRPIQRRRNTGRVASIMLRCMGDGFVGANRVTPHAMDIEWSGARAARAPHRDAEADVRSADVCYQSQHRRAVKLIQIRMRAGKRVIDCHHLAPKNRKSCATVDNAVNQMAAGFYLLIKVSVACPHGSDDPV